MKRERDDIEDILATAAEKVLKHQVNANAEVMNATVAIGNLSALRQEVTMHFRRINRIDKKKKQTLLHVCCREGFFEPVDFMLNPDNHPKRDNVPVDLKPGTQTAQPAVALFHSAAYDHGDAGAACCGHLPARTRRVRPYDPRGPW